MNVLGIRCSNKDFTYVVMSGTRNNPVVHHSDSITFPRNYSKPRSLLWFLREIEHLISKHGVRMIVLKGFEGRTRGKTYEERVEHEAAVYMAAAMSGVNGIFKKVKSTIAKDLGFKGRGHYLQTSLDTSVIPNYADKSEKEQEAILAAWSELK
jgi:hypothetical protein